MRKPFFQQKSIQFLFSILILGIALFLRLYQLTNLPLELHIDEAGLGLNAWSIANYGTDRYGNYLPVCPINFYGEQSAFYTYLCAIFVKLLGLNMLSLRLPAVIMGMTSLIFGSLIAKMCFGKKGFFIALLLFTFCPYFITNSRFALDCNAMLGMLSLSVYLLLYSIKKSEHYLQTRIEMSGDQSPEQKNPLSNKNKERSNIYLPFVFAGICFGITLYTYIISTIVLFLFCLSFGIYYWLYKAENRALHLKQLLCMAIPMGILAIPLLLLILVEVSGKNAIVTPLFSIIPTVGQRASDFSLSLGLLKERILGLLHIITTDGKYGSSLRYWTLYQVSIPFLFIGAVGSIKEAIKDIRKHSFSTHVLILLLTISEVITYLFCGNSNYHANGIYMELVYFTVFGILLIGTAKPKTNANENAENKHTNNSYKGLSQIYTVGLFLLYTLFFVGFCREYFFEKTDSYSRVFAGLESCLELVDSSSPVNYVSKVNAVGSLETPSYQIADYEIYVLDEVGEFYLLSHPIPPEEMSLYVDEMGYVRDYQNLHFYVPDNFPDCLNTENRLMLICGRNSSWDYLLQEKTESPDRLQKYSTDYYSCYILK